MFTAILPEYADFANVFSSHLIVELLKPSRINGYIIGLIDGIQPPYEPIKSLKLVEMETSIIYIKTSLAINFIRPFKSLVDILILFCLEIWW